MSHSLKDCGIFGCGEPAVVTELIEAYGDGRHVWAGFCEEHKEGGPMATKQRYEIHISCADDDAVWKAGGCRLEEPPKPNEVLRVRVRQRRYVDVQVDSVKEGVIHTHQVAGTAAFFTELESFGYTALECRQAGLDIKGQVRLATAYFSDVLTRGIGPKSCNGIATLTKTLRRLLEESTGE